MGCVAEGAAAEALGVDAAGAGAYGLAPVFKYNGVVQQPLGVGCVNNGRCGKGNRC